MAQARFHLHVYGFDKQDAFKDEVIYAEVAREWFNAYLSFGLSRRLFQSYNLWKQIMIIRIWILLFHALSSSFANFKAIIFYIVIIL
jgi:hypothetical protein